MYDKINIKYRGMHRRIIIISCFINGIEESLPFYKDAIFIKIDMMCRDSL